MYRKEQKELLCRFETMKKEERTKKKKEKERIRLIYLLESYPLDISETLN
jgi:hypothetical protein